MSTQTQIVFRGIKHDAELIEAVERRLAHLERLQENLVHCTVLLRKQSGHQRGRSRHHVTIDLVAPGLHICGRSRDNRSEQNDIHSCIAEAFDSVERQLTIHRSLILRRSRTRKPKSPTL